MTLALAAVEGRVAAAAAAAAGLFSACAIATFTMTAAALMSKDEVLNLRLCCWNSFSGCTDTTHTYAVHPVMGGCCKFQSHELRWKAR
jgi:hypothetical protein